MSTPTVANVDQYTLETPENIEVHFDLAGIGSRFCAILIDSILLFGCCLALFILFGVVLAGALPSLGDWPRRHRLAEWVSALLLAILMVLMTEGYFIFFEWLMRGQTPGKKSMKIRVIRDDGTAIGGSEVLIRNLLRIVDFLPAGYAVGMLFMFPNPLCKRLGDIAAGTIVVKEGLVDYRATTDRKKFELSRPVSTANAELTPEERRLLSGFLQRREQLLPQARNDLARRLAQPLLEKYGGYGGDPERYLELLVEGRHHES